MRERTGQAPGVAAAVADLRRRYGPAVIRTGAGASAAAPDGLSTGIPALDALTGGGFPRGRITCWTGRPGAGSVPLALAVLAEVSREAPVALVDFTHQVDPADLCAYGGDLAQCWVVRPRCPEEGWAAVRGLVRAGVVMCLGVCHPRDPALAAVPPALPAAVAEAGAVCQVAGDEEEGDRWRRASHLVLRCSAPRWWWVHGDVAGVDVTVQVARRRGGAPGARAGLRVRFPRPYPPGAGVEALGEEPVAGWADPKAAAVG